jgi:polyisoprenoid-binding protein YceI
MSRRARWLIAAPVALVALIVGGTWFYLNVIQGPAPKPLAFSTSGTTVPSGVTSAATGPAAGGAFTFPGSWRPTSASVLGYRIKETLLGQSHTAVGRTNAITGDLAVNGTTVTAASFTVDMTKVSSDDGQRDRQFQGRIMRTSTFPTATFTLTSPITVPADPADQQELSFKASGDLMLHGVTKSVSFTLKARRNASNLEVNGSIPITFADYGVNNPSGGPATTDDNGLLEFLIVLQHA